MPVLNGDAFDNYLYGGATKDTINGLDGNDNLYGNDGNDNIYGGSDDDYIDGGNGADKSYGGDGYDRIVSGAGDTVNGGADTDLASVDFSAFGGNHAIVMDFSAGHNNTLGHNLHIVNCEILQLTTGSGNDTLALDDSAVYGAANDSGRWYGGNGDDDVTVDWHGQIFSVYANQYGISIGSTSYSWSGIERFNYTSGSGADTLAGGEDNDSLHAGAGRDNIYGYGGNDTLDGGADDDYIYAGYNYDSSGADTVDGGDGDDIVYASSGDDVDGGAGSDQLILDLADHSDDATATLDGGNETLLDASFNHVERLILNTGSGNDTITMLSGAAISTPDYAEYTWNAGAGVDKLVIDFSDVIFNVSANAFQLTVVDFTVTYSNVESYEFTGGSGFDGLNGADVADTLTGNGGNDTLYGFGAGDTLDGGTGRDTLYGGTGNDVEKGGLGRDTVYGDDGNDNLNAGAGNDTVSGGIGTDTIVGGVGFDSITGGADADTVDGGADADVIIYTTLTDSKNTGYDAVNNFDFSGDTFRFTGTTIGALDPTVATGTLNAASFDADMEGRIGAMKLLGGDAVIWTPDAGDMAGTTWLIVDKNATAGYQAGFDYLIQLGTPVNLGSADLSDLQG